jgi:predicted nucleic acid-binding protein
VITVYVECPFVLQLALKQEHAEYCERIASAATGGAFEIALPIVALVGPLYVQRGDLNERRKLASAWRAQANQLKRTNAVTHQDAVAAMEEALVKVAPIDDADRTSIADTIARLSRTCRLLPFHESLFAQGFSIERRMGLTSVDALAVATILDEARTLNPLSHDRAFLALDKKSMASAIPELRAAGVQMCGEPASLEAWLKARGVTL